MARGKTAFERGFTQRWSVELFRVSRVHKDNNPVLYEATDTIEEPVKGTFSEQELQKVQKPEAYDVEKIIRTQVEITVTGKVATVFGRV